MSNKKKPINGNTSAQVKPKAAQKQAPPKEESDDETPAQSKKKVVKAPRKGSKASVDEDAPAPRKASVEKPNTKKPVKAKEPSSDEE